MGWASAPFWATLGTLPLRVTCHSLKDHPHLSSTTGSPESWGPSSQHAWTAARISHSVFPGPRLHSPSATSASQISSTAPAPQRHGTLGASIALLSTQKSCLAAHPKAHSPLELFLCGTVWLPRANSHACSWLQGDLRQWGSSLSVPVVVGGFCLSPNLKKEGTSLAVQWLRCCASNAEGLG